MSDNWNVKPEKPERSERSEAQPVIKNRIEDNTITIVNQVKKPSTCEEIKVKPKPYDKPPRDLREEMQTAFNGNAKSSYSPIRIEKKIPNIKNPKNKSPLISNRINLPNLSPPPKEQIQVRIQESSLIDKKVDFMAEIFSSIPKNIINDIVKKNFNCTDNELFEKISMFQNNEEANKCKTNNVKANKGEYKKSLCIKQKDCTNPFCEFFHFKGERRRTVDNYVPSLCNKKNCDFFEACECAHSLSEVFYHSSVYKKLKCPFEKCPLEELCVFSHDSKQVLCSLADKLNNELKETQEKWKQARESSEKLKNEIDQLKVEKKELRQKLVCSKCSTYRITYVFTSCGHCVCSMCVSGYTENPVCTKCKKKTKFIEIVYPLN